MSQRFHQQSRDLLKHHHLTVVSSVVYNCTYWKNLALTKLVHGPNMFDVSKLNHNLVATTIHPGIILGCSPLSTYRYSGVLWVHTQYIPGMLTTLYLLLLWSTPHSYLLSTSQIILGCPPLSTYCYSGVLQVHTYSVQPRIILGCSPPSTYCYSGISLWAVTKQILCISHDGKYWWNNNFFNLNKSSYNYCSLDEYQVYFTLNEIARG